MASRRHRRCTNELQLELSGEWAPRSCLSPHHRGNPEVPVDQFVRNGIYRRTVCRACWATQNRGQRRDDRSRDDDALAMVKLLNKLWRPMRTSA